MRRASPLQARGQMGVSAMKLDRGDKRGASHLTRRAALERIGELLLNKTFYLSIPGHNLWCNGTSRRPERCTCGQAACARERDMLMAALRKDRT